MTGELNGIIVINKEADWTSFDVVAKLKGVLKERRIGHGGTLDPMATGVLLVFIGKATKACDILPNEYKSYRAKFKLGITTDTLDITGTVLETFEKKATEQDVKDTAEKFVGEIMQVPPMYSAIKINGQKLCNLARQGVVIERQARPVSICGINILSFDEENQCGEMHVDCKKGTYIRSLIDDIGKELGCGAVMTELVRTSSAGFIIEGSHTISEVAEIYAQGKLSEILLPTERAFKSIYHEIKLDERLTVLYKNGVKLSPQQFGMNNPQMFKDKTLSVYGDNCEFLGLGYIDVEKNELRSLKNFY